MLEEDPKVVWARSFTKLVGKVIDLGFPKEFGEAIAKSLGSPKAMDRMYGYLCAVEPKSAEDIADEMLAINSDISRWKEKKNAEYYNSKYNELLYYGLDDTEE